MVHRQNKFYQDKDGFWRAKIGNINYVNEQTVANIMIKTGKEIKKWHKSRKKFAEEEVM